jgi:hypothetical protein
MPVPCTPTANKFSSMKSPQTFMQGKFEKKATGSKSVLLAQLVALMYFQVTREL